MRYIVAMLVAVLLAGCAATTPYDQPVRDHLIKENRLLIQHLLKIIELQQKRIEALERRGFVNPARRQPGILKARKLIIPMNIGVEWWGGKDGQRNPETVAQFIQIYRSTRVPCSCWMCKNPRKAFGHRTIQELRQIQSAREQIAELDRRPVSVAV
jgi:hypothetical protein